MRGPLAVATLLVCLASAVSAQRAPTVIVFRDGSRLEVAHYAQQGPLLVFETPEGRLQSIPLSLVDLEATRSGGPSTSEAATPPAGSEAPMASARSSARTPAGPPPPVAPSTINRDASGRATVRAVRATEPPSLDGVLDEAIYASTPPMSGFIQQEPLAGQLATEQTEVWVLFDEKNLYVAARCWDSHPEDMVANELRRDNFGIFLNDNFAVVLDTFYDRRNGVWFYTNPLGALSDGQITDERDTNRDWNTVWNVRTGRFEGGWTVEMAIPFKSIRYRPGAEQVWGINFRRVVRGKNEWSYLTPINPAFGMQGMIKVSQAATLVGVEPPSRTINLEVKPYLKSGLRTDRTLEDPVENDLDGDFGFDVKYGLTRGLIADFTYNTDFAEVEADEQQINLTRFNLFFPEKREFFLEGQGIFAFGGRQTTRNSQDAGDVPILFFSRQIGLSSTGIVPTRAGARLTGRAGAYTVGALAMQTDAVSELERGIPVTNFSVLRLKRNILRRSNIGILATHRSPDVANASSNSVFGVDGNFTFYQNLNVNTYYSKSRTPELSGDDESYRASVVYGSDRYGAEFEHLAVGDAFSPEIGFVRRSDFVKTAGNLRFSPALRWQAIRKLTYEGNFDYYVDGNGDLSTQLGRLTFGLDFDNGDTIGVDYVNDIEVLTEPFDISSGVTLPVGEYGFQFMRYSYNLGPQRRVSGGLSFQHGGFYSGNRSEVGYNGKIEVTPQLSVEPNLSFNWVDLEEGSFTTRLVSTRVNYTHTPRTSFSGLVQYNSSANAISANLRFRWEYQPGSDFFVVYNDLRDDDLFGYSRVANRALIIKFTRLFRF